jgi:hypothetical protein
MAEREDVMTERELLDAIRAACKWGGLLCYHTHDSRRSEPGYPDVTVCGPRGVLFRELKSDRGRLSSEQWTWLERLTEAGADADVWRPDSWPDRVLTELAGIGGRLPTTQRQAAS